ncbi:MAG TPA: MFS transporter [Burkholderiaceae bacterium]|jgi:PAT family beta-lactamase induction signal transducer AmpG
MNTAPAHDNPSTAELWARLRQDRRYLAMLGLGFSSGIPYQLVYYTQSDWWTQAGVPIGIIGLLGELAIAYQLKFLWAPFLDSYAPPLLGRWLGKRRGWIVLAQLGCMGSLAGVAYGDPGHFLAWTIAFSLALGIFGATQDAAIDGWRINAAPEGKQALMNSFSEIGYRFGSLASGAVALSLGQHLGWRAAYLCMAALLLLSAGFAWLAPETELDRLPPGPRPTLLETVWIPLKDLVTRLGRFAIPVLVLIAGFRLPGYLTSAMAMPLFKHLQYSEDHIALVTKTFGFFIGIAATMFSAWLVRRIGILRSLFIGTASASASHLALAWLAAHGNEFWAFCLAVSIEGFAYVFAQMVLITFMSLIVSKEHATAQFALLTSLCALLGHQFAAGSGLVVAHFGFPFFFVGSALVGLPVAWLAWWIWRRGFSVDHIVQQQPASAAPA